MYVNKQIILQIVHSSKVEVPRVPSLQIFHIYIVNACVRLSCEANKQARGLRTPF